MTRSNFHKSRFYGLMNYATYQILEGMVLESQKMPYPLKPSAFFNKSRGANLLTGIIVFYLKQEGHFAYRNSTQGISRKVGGRIIHTQNKSMKGSSDIVATVHGGSLFIEIKFGDDKQSLAQKEFQENVEASGAKYWIVKNFDDFLDNYNQLMPESNE